MPRRKPLPEVAIVERSPSDLWRAKEELAKREWASRKYWSGIEDNARAGLLLAVKDTLLRLLENLDGWVPLALDPQSPHRIDVCIALELPEITESAMNARVNAERLSVHAAEGLLRIERELREAGNDAP